MYFLDWSHSKKPLTPWYPSPAVQDEAPGLGCEVAERDVRRDAPFPGLGEHLALEAAREGLGPRLDGAFLERQAPVGDDLVLVDDGHIAEAVTFRAGALGTVEREQVREGVLVCDPAFLALELVGHGIFPALRGPDHGPAAALLEGQLDGVRQALPLLGVRGQAVDKDVERAFLRRPRLLQVDHRAALEDPEEALLFQLGRPLAGRPGEAYGELGPGGEGEEGVDDRVDRVPPDGPAALLAVHGPDPGVEDPEEVVDLGDGRHGGPGVLARGLLLDGDGRRDPFDEVGVRLVHPLQELAGVGGKGFDVAALALGVERVERQGGLPRAGDAGHDDEFIQRDVHVHVLQVVDPDAAELDAVVGHFGLWQNTYYIRARPLCPTRGVI